MKKLLRTFIIVLVAGVVLPASQAEAQGIRLSPVLGVHVRGDDLTAVRTEAAEAQLAGRAALGIGADLGVGFLRASVRYATGAELTRAGVANGEHIGSGSFLTAAGSVVLRPIPRIIGFRPFVVGGLGIKREGFSYDDPAWGDLLPDDQTTTALHVALGADIMLGRIGVTAEVGDYISLQAEEGEGRHDIFATIGLCFRLF